MLKKYFNKAASSYDDNAILQESTGNKLFSLIRENAFSHENIIDIGCGTGLMTKVLATHLTYHTFHALDISENSLSIAKKRLQPFNIQFIESHFDTFEPNMTFDLIYSNMSLHWSENIFLTIKRLLSLLKKNGKLVFSIPMQGTFIELKPHVRVQQFVEKNTIINQFKVLHHETENIILTFPSMLTALQSIKKTGANYVSQNFSGLQCNPFLKKLLLNPSHDSTTLTYHIGYFVLESSYVN